MVLEDDFEFDIYKMTSQNNIDPIRSFFEKRKKEDFIYNLGPMPILFYPFLIDGYHYKSIKSLSTHSIIYSKNIQNKIFDFLLHHNFQYKYSKYYDLFITTFYTHYFYYTPLCYQTDDNYNKLKFYSLGFYTKMVDKLVKGIHEIRQTVDQITNNKHQLWFVFFIIFNYLIFILFIITILYIFFQISKIIIYHKKIKK